MIQTERLDRYSYCLFQIREQDDWDKSLKAGGKYYFTRSVLSLLV